MKPCLLRVLIVFLTAIHFAAGETVFALEDALDEALENNLDLQIIRLQPADALDAVEIEEAAFDWELFSRSEMSEFSSASTASAQGAAPISEGESRDFRVGGDKVFSTGGALTVDTGVERSASRPNVGRNPDYDSDVGLSFRQPLLRGAWREVNLAPIARSKLAHQQSLFQLKGEILDVLSAAELAYLELAHAIAARELIRSSIQQATRLLDENSERARLGVAIPLEVLQAETVLSERQEELILANRRIADAADGLYFILGRESSEYGSGLSVNPLPSEIPELSVMEESVRNALAGDTDLSLQERVLESEKIDRMLAEDGLKPELDFVGGLRYSGSDHDGVDSFLGAYQNDGYSWSAGFEVRVPWGNREAKAQFRQAERSVESAELILVQLKREVVLNTRRAWRDVETGRARLGVARKTLKLSEATFEQERARYQSGAVPYRDVLDAQRELDTARSNELNVRADALRALVRLSRIDGSLLERHGYSWELVGATSGAGEPNTL